MPGVVSRLPVPSAGTGRETDQHELLTSAAPTTMATISVMNLAPSCPVPCQLTFMPGVAPRVSAIRATSIAAGREHHAFGDAEASCAASGATSDLPADQLLGRVGGLDARQDSAFLAADVEAQADELVRALDGLGGNTVAMRRSSRWNSAMSVRRGLFRSFSQSWAAVRPMRVPAACRSSVPSRHHHACHRRGIDRSSRVRRCRCAYRAAARARSARRRRYAEEALGFPATPGSTGFR